MTEYIPTPEDDELEATIGRLFDQLEDAREGQHRIQDDRAPDDGLRNRAGSTA